MLENLSSSIELLATVFGVLMSLSFFPQTYKLIKRKSSDDISILTYFILIPGIVVWIIYGININSFPLISSNIIALFGAGSIAILYFVYKSD